MQKYQTEIFKLLPKFDECQLDQIPRIQNIEADDLAKLVVSTKSLTFGDRSVVHLLRSTLDCIEVKFVNLTRDWRNCIINYFHDGTLPNDKKEARKLRM